MYISLFVKYPLFLLHIHETLIFGTDFLEKYSDIKFHENPTSGSGAVLCGQTDERTDGRRDRYDEANISFPQFCGNAPKNRKYVYMILHYCMKFGGEGDYDP